LTKITFVSVVYPPLAKPPPCANAIPPGEDAVTVFESTRTFVSVVTSSSLD
jgi:hypothetical protein